MKVFTNNKFEGYYPVGSAAVVIAKDKDDAARLLSDKLFNIGLNPSVTSDSMIEVNIEESHAVILVDGNY